MFRALFQYFNSFQNSPNLVLCPRTDMREVRKRAVVPLKPKLGGGGENGVVVPLKPNLGGGVCENEVRPRDAQLEGSEGLPQCWENGTVAPPPKYLDLGARNSASKKPL